MAWQGTWLARDFGLNLERGLFKSGVGHHSVEHAGFVWLRKCLESCGSLAERFGSESLK